jgi:non-ribosomal peptide synthetase component F
MFTQKSAIRLLTQLLVWTLVRLPAVAYIVRQRGATVSTGFSSGNLAYIYYTFGSSGNVSVSVSTVVNILIVGGGGKLIIVVT